MKEVESFSPTVFIAIVIFNLNGNSSIFIFVGSRLNGLRLQNNDIQMWMGYHESSMIVYFWSSKINLAKANNGKRILQGQKRERCVKIDWWCLWFKETFPHKTRRLQKWTPIYFIQIYSYISLVSFFTTYNLELYFLYIADDIWLFATIF